MRALLRACNAHADINVVELRRLEHPFVAEIIVADVGDGAVSPGNDAGIHRIERIALLYRTGARFPFEARPLRKSFRERCISTLRVTKDRVALHYGGRLGACGT
uniref:USC1-1p n=1 Tax=Myxococcus xanthus TaxID=34 RepID=Q93SL2_MYXXA|nr:USC1-1p [Myxococcus xanthus]